jgi:uncharacterized protein (UPF0335 family)
MFKWNLNNEDIHYTERDLNNPNEDSTELDTLDVNDETTQDIERIKDDTYEQIIEKIEEYEHEKAEEHYWKDNIKFIYKSFETYDTLSLYKDILTNHGLSQGIYALIDPYNKFQFDTNALPIDPVINPECNIITNSIDIALEGIGSFFSWIWEKIIGFFTWLANLFGGSKSKLAVLSGSKSFTGQTFKQYVESVKTKIPELTPKIETAINALEAWCTNEANKVISLSKLSSGLSLLFAKGIVDKVVHSFEDIEHLYNDTLVEILNYKDQAGTNDGLNKADSKVQSKYLIKMFTAIQDLNIMCNWQLVSGAKLNYQIDKLFLNYAIGSAYSGISSSQKLDAIESVILVSLYTQPCGEELSHFVTEYNNIDINENELKSKVTAIKNSIQKTDTKLETAIQNMNKANKAIQSQTSLLFPGVDKNNPCILDNLQFARKYQKALVKVLAEFISIYFKEVSVFVNSVSKFNAAIKLLNKLTQTNNSLK